jgi:hypothetical protein
MKSEERMVDRAKLCLNEEFQVMCEPLKKDMHVIINDKQRTLENRIKTKTENLFKDAGRMISIPGLVASNLSGAIEKRDCEFTTFT